MLHIFVTLHNQVSPAHVHTMGTIEINTLHAVMIFFVEYYRVSFSPSANAYFWPPNYSAVSCNKKIAKPELRYIIRLNVGSSLSYIDGFPFSKAT